MEWYTYSGFADEISPDLTTQMDVLEKLGISYLEPRGCGGKNVSKLTPEEAKEIKKGWDARGFRVSALGSPIGKVTLDTPLEDELILFRNVLEIARIFDTKYIRIFSCLIPEEEPVRKYRDRVLSRMQAYVDAVRGTDFILLHENEGGRIYGQAPHDCLDIFESIGSPQLRATYDPGNFVYSGFDALEGYEVLKDYIEYIHIKDANPDKTIVPAGFGSTPFPEIMKKLKEHGKHFFLSLEPHLTAFEGLDDIDGNHLSLPRDASGAEKFCLAYECIDKIIKSI